MSFNDLSAKATAAEKAKPVETSKDLPATKGPEAIAKEPASKPRTP